MKTIAESEYVIAPYFSDQYQGNRTSGVIRDAIYLRSTVIAPRQILQNMRINGIGYEDWSDVKNFFLSGSNLHITNDLTPFSSKFIKDNLKAHLDNLFA